jgi:O-antigen/teichoic acid export membrane protein
MTRQSFALLFAAEIFASVIGFGVMITLARRLGPARFADFEYGTAVAAWWLVIVRGGFDAIVYREAARRPRLIRPLTNLLIGLRIISMAIGLVAILLFAWLSGPSQCWPVAVAGLILIPSALAADVGVRAESRLGSLAMIQVIRITLLALGVTVFVQGQGDLLGALACLFVAESATTITFLVIHGKSYNSIQPRLRWKALKVLASRGSLAGATRFLRVSLYAIDLMILANLAPSPDLGPYAAARRVCFALLALGLVVPAALGPRIAVEWTRGVDATRSLLVNSCEIMFTLALPATLGLICNSDRWLVTLFGDSFRDGGPWLALIAARIPFVLASNLHQSALVACRRELWALGLMSGMVAVGLIAVPLLALRCGTTGATWGVLAIEAGGAVAGWLALRRLEIAPIWHHSNAPTLVGCLGLFLICSVGQGWPLGILVPAAASVYGAIVGVVSVWNRPRESSILTRLRPVATGESA